MITKRNLKAQLNKPTSSDFSSGLDSIERWMLKDGIIDEVVAFNPHSPANPDKVVEKIWNNRQSLHFCLSDILIPPGFKFIKDPIKVGTPIDINDLENMVKRSQVIDSSNFSYFYFIHDINQNNQISHPCTEFGIVGAKACAYSVFTTSSDDIGLVDNFAMMFYCENPPSDVVKKLDDLLRNEWVGKLPPTDPPPYTIPVDADHWPGIFVMPLMLPISTIMYLVVPNMPDGSGRNYLKTKIDEFKQGTWFGIDYTFAFIDEWVSLVTLDIGVYNC